MRDLQMCLLRLELCKYLWVHHSSGAKEETRYKVSIDIIHLNIWIISLRCA